MSLKITWLIIFLLLYSAYCIFGGVKGTYRTQNPLDFFISGRKLPMWVFLFAATACSFSGWTFLAHPGLIFRDGFQYAYMSFCVIIIPFTGLIFFKRQWMLGKHFGYVTPGEMFADYFKGNMIRILTVVIALFFSIPFLGLQLAASGKLFNFLSDGFWSFNTSTLFLTFILTFYVMLGGLRSLTYVSILQCILLWFGILVIGFIAYNLIGGWEILNNSFAEIALVEGTRWNKAPGSGYSAYFAIPDLIQLTAGIGKATPVGGLWTGAMIFTTMLAFMGIQSSPAFSMLAFSNKDPKPFAPQQVWVSSLAIGFALFLFSTIQGMGSHILGADPIVNDAKINISNVLSESIGKGGEGNLVLYLIKTVEESAPWLLGLLAICALAAIQSTGALFISTGASMITRDIYKKNFKQNMNYVEQKFYSRLSIIIIVTSALIILTLSEDLLILLGGLAMAFGFQMWVPLAAICYIPWLTKEGISWGLLGGILGVMITDSIGQAFVGDFIPWGRWPLTMHSAFWGMLVNLIITITVSVFTQNSEDRLHRQKYHDFLNTHDELPKLKENIKPKVALLITIAWFFFSIGPGAIIGNDIFGSPNDHTTWIFGIPSIWAWQILFWLLGVGMMWFLAYKLGMSTLPKKDIIVLSDDFGNLEK